MGDITQLEPRQHNEPRGPGKLVPFRRPRNLGDNLLDAATTTFMSANFLDHHDTLSDLSESQVFQEAFARWPRLVNNEPVAYLQFLSEAYTEWGWEESLSEAEVWSGEWLYDAGHLGLLGYHLMEWHHLFPLSKGQYRVGINRARRTLNSIHEEYRDEKMLEGILVVSALHPGLAGTQRRFEREATRDLVQSMPYKYPWYRAR